LPDARGSSTATGGHASGLRRLSAGVLLMNQLVPVCRMFEKTKAFQRRPAAQGCIPGTHDRSACASVNARTADIFLPDEFAVDLAT
jgi:hypothetical protein